MSNTVFQAFFYCEKSLIILQLQKQTTAVYSREPITVVHRNLILETGSGLLTMLKLVSRELRRLPEYGELEVKEELA